jgi:hypothetical protein
MPGAPRSSPIATNVTRDEAVGPLRVPDPRPSIAAAEYPLPAHSEVVL